jgi:hypothetical protein
LSFLATSTATGLFVIHVPGAGAGPAVSGQIFVRGQVEALVRYAPSPAVTRRTEGKNGPLFVNTMMIVTMSSCCAYSAAPRCSPDS